MSVAICWLVLCRVVVCVCLSVVMHARRAPRRSVCARNRQRPGGHPRGPRRDWTQLAHTDSLILHRTASHTSASIRRLGPNRSVLVVPSHTPGLETQASAEFSWVLTTMHAQGAEPKPTSRDCMHHSCVTRVILRVRRCIQIFTCKPAPTSGADCAHVWPWCHHCVATCSAGYVLLRSAGM